jgi:hypothetical protein
LLALLILGMKRVLDTWNFVPNYSCFSATPNCFAFLIIGMDCPGGDLQSTQIIINPENEDDR